ncbi:hypothetical protein ACQEVF_58325 [Nonomuraea polychroma]|uniref:hypothetical protein n=1 Tax=Nonomuraea polychroma TaxID=46176 RepID=UPI003D92A266
MARPRPQTIEHEQEQEPTFEWEPYKPSGAKLRSSHTSCCGQYEWACEGGLFLVLRRSSNGRYEETGRGVHNQAIAVYIALVEQHNRDHRARGERPEPDTFLPRQRGRRD